MAKVLLKLINFLLYSSIWIGLCSSAQVYLTYFCTDHPLAFPDPYALFVFGATISLYSIHRFVGTFRLGNHNETGRFAIVWHHRKAILILGMTAGLFALWQLTQLQLITIKWLIVPVTISALYVLPVMPGRERLRDLPFIKIFVIALVWSTLVTVVPLAGSEYRDSVGKAWIMLERALFIFAITIPFDIRDEQVDRDMHLQTLVHRFGLRGSKLIALAAMCASGAINIFLISNGTFSRGLFLPYLAFLTITCLLIWFSSPARSDYYFSGLLDGTMLILPVFLSLSRYVAHI